jgi:transcription-repair coupling factor (superfamily II helicase)
MLSEAVRSLKAGKEPDLLSPLSVTTDINLHAPALLPDDYCGDVHLRLSFYKKLATAKNSEQIDALLEEIVDRFGKLPAQAQTLIDVHRLRVLARPYGVVKVDAAPGVIQITFRPNPPVDPMRIIELVQKNRHIKLAGNEKLRIERELAEPKDRAQMVRDVLRSLGQPVQAAAPEKPPMPELQELSLQFEQFKQTKEAEEKALKAEIKKLQAEAEAHSASVKMYAEVHTRTFNEDRALRERNR